MSLGRRRQGPSCLPRGRALTAVRRDLLGPGPLTSRTSPGCPCACSVPPADVPGLRSTSSQTRGQAASCAPAVTAGAWEWLRVPRKNTKATAIGRARSGRVSTANTDLSAAVRPRAGPDARLAPAVFYGLHAAAGFQSPPRLPRRGLEPASAHWPPPTQLSGPEPPPAPSHLTSRWGPRLTAAPLTGVPAQAGPRPWALRRPQSRSLQVRVPVRSSARSLL